MNKELLTIEFRYNDKRFDRDDYDYKNKTITIGVFDSLEEAIAEGNKVLDVLAEKFEVRAEDKFKLKHLFGSPKRLVTNTCYPTNGIQYFAKIEQLKFDDLNEVIDEAFAGAKRYKDFRIRNDS